MIFFPPTYKCQSNVAGWTLYLGMFTLNIEISCNKDHPPSHCQCSYNFGLCINIVWPKYTLAVMFDLFSTSKVLLFHCCLHIVDSVIFSSFCIGYVTECKG